jgi:hypothetical protein
MYYIWVVPSSFADSNGASRLLFDVAIFVLIICYWIILTLL